MKKILFLACLCFATAVMAKEVTVTATGIGEDYDWAVLNAVENAVRQTSDISIESNGLQKIDASATVTREKAKISASNEQGGLNFNAAGEYGREGKLAGDGQYQRSVNAEEGERETITSSVKDNSKVIPAKYKGVVSSYEVLEQFEKDGKVHVKIQAVVIKEDVYDPHDYKSKSLVKKADYSLAVVPFKMAPNLRCLGQKVSGSEMNEIIANLFVENLAPSRKFNLVDRNNFASYQNELDLIAGDMTLPENKVRLKNIVPADYILVGTVDNFTATTSKQHIALTGETSQESSASIKISYRILEAATMEIVSVGSVTKKFGKEGAFSSCFNVEELLLRRAITEASERLLTDIFPDYQPKQKVEPKKKAVRQQKVAEPDYSLQLD